MSRFANSAAFANAYATNKNLGEAAAHAAAAPKGQQEIPVAPIGLFRKPLTVNSRTPLKASQSKKIRDTIREAFPKVLPDEWEACWNKKANVTTEKLSGGLISEDQHKPLLYYIKNDDDKEKNSLGLAMFVDLSGGHSDKHMIWPLLPALTLAPSLLPPLLVHAAVSQFIVRGSDVMWPGVIRYEGDGLSRFQKGERRALVAKGNPVPLAVGWLSMDSAGLIASGGKGHALSIVHAYQDELWKLQPFIPNIGYVKDRVYGITSGEAKESDDEDESASLDKLNIKDGESWENGPMPAASSSTAVSTDSFHDAGEIVAPPSDTSAPDVANSSSAIESNESAAPAAENPEAAAAAASEEQDENDDEGEIDDAADEAEEDEGDAESAESEQAGEKHMTSAEMDAALLKSFLYALQLRIEDSSLPMDASTLLSHMQLCNIISSEKLDVKRSSYKQMSKFVKELGKMGLAKSKTGGGKQGMCSCELKIMSVNRASPLLSQPEYQASPLVIDAVKKKVKEGSKAHAKGAAAAESAASSSSSSSLALPERGQPQVLHMYRADGKVLRLMSAVADLSDVVREALGGSSPEANRLWRMKDAKQFLWDYVQLRQLDLQQKVKLDPLLIELFYSSGGKIPIEATKADLSNRFDSHMTELYAIAFGSPDSIDIDQLKFKPGPVPCVEASLEQRQGKKQVTKVSGLEFFGVDPMVFAKEAQKAVGYPLFTILRTVQQRLFQCELITRSLVLVCIVESIVCVQFSCSTTTNVISATTKHKAHVEVFVQGDVRKEMGDKLQQMYGIPPQFVKVITQGKK